MALVVPAAAVGAITTSVDGGGVVVINGDGEVRSGIVVSRPTSTQVRIALYGSPYTANFAAAGTGCSGSGGGPITCTVSASGTPKVRVNMGSNADRVELDGVRAESLQGGGGADILYGSSEADVIYGNDDGDLLEGRGGDDILFGGDGGDLLRGGDGNDMMVGGKGPDELDGGPGSADIAVYHNENSGGRTPWDDSRTTGVAVSLDDVRNDGSAADDAGPNGAVDDVRSSTERVWGTRWDDTLLGSDRAGELLNGWSGNDVLDAGGGNDRMLGDNGDDVLRAQDGVADSEVNCDNSGQGAVPGTRDVASIDAADRPTTGNCETVEEAAAGAGPGAGTGGGAGAGAGVGGSPPAGGSAPENCATSIKVGPLRIDGSACMDRKGLVWEAKGQVTIAGLKFVPNNASARLTIDVFNLSIRASGSYSVVLEGEISGRRFGPLTLFSGSNFSWSFQWTPRLKDVPGVFQAIQNGPAVAMSAISRLPGLARAATLPTIPRFGLPDYSQVQAAAVKQLMSRIPSLSTKQVSVDLQSLGMPALPVIRVGPEGINWGDAPKKQNAASHRQNATVDLGDGSLFGLGFAGAIEIQPASQGGRDGASLSLGLKLPSVLEGISASAKVFIGQDGSASISSAGASVTQVGVAPLYLKPVRLSYDWNSDTWEGGTTLFFGVKPEMGFGGDIKITKGVLKSIGVRTSGLPAPFGPTAVFDRLNGSLAFDPINFNADVAVSFGPVVPVLQKKMFTVDGRASYSSGNNASVAFSGGATAAGTRLLDASISYYFSGMVRAEGRMSRFLDAAGKLGFDGSVKGEASARGANLEGAVDFRANTVVLGGTALVSTRGVAACARARTGFGDLQTGAGYRWGDSSITWLGGSCDLSPFRAKVSAERPTGAREMASGPQTIRVARGTKALVLQVTGASGPPRLSIAGPGGRVVESPGDNQPVQGDGYIIIPQSTDNTTSVAIARPAPGPWTVTPLDGADVGPVRTADPLPPARVRGSISGRTLRFAATPIRGQSITFTEQGRETSTLIGTTTRARGSLRFTPARGPAGVRRIIATVEQDGMPRARFTVARFRAKAPTLGTPRVRVTRGAGGGAQVSWTSVRSARQYEVAASYNGTSYTHLLPSGTRSLPLPDVLRRSPLSVRVRAVSDYPRLGKWGTTQLKRPKAPRISTPKRRR